MTKNNLFIMTMEECTLQGFIQINELLFDMEKDTNSLHG